MKNIMVICRETAMLLWKKRFGKAVTATDFAGRTINKGAYDDRKSEYGWNLDHVLPRSKGGKDSEHNLICCHIKTNDDKADKFPHFASNDKKFEIIKVQNHYEIKELNSDLESKKQKDLNLYDSAAGVRYIEKLKKMENREIFEGTVEITLLDVKSLTIVEFCKKIFDVDNFKFSYGKDEFDSSKIKIRVNNYNMPENDDVQDLLDKCILFNTYAENYFVLDEAIGGWHIFYGVICKDSETSSNELTFDVSIDYDMIVNELVKINCDAVKDLKNGKVVGYDSYDNELYEYNYTYSNLAKNLRKEFNK